jgi:hypothetical protein
MAVIDKRTWPMTVAPSGGKAMVDFGKFWERLGGALSNLPGPEPGVHVRTIPKWSQSQGPFGDDFTLVYESGRVSVSERTWRTDISLTQARKMYEVWADYRAGRVTRTRIMHEIGVQHSQWIIPILHEYENLMS